MVGYHATGSLKSLAVVVKRAVDAIKSSCKTRLIQTDGLGFPLQILVIANAKGWKIPTRASENDAVWLKLLSRIGVLITKSQNTILKTDEREGE